jgi:ATP-dependent Clp protease ATP-binding subunit ClpB
MAAAKSWRLEGYASDAKTAIAGAQALADERSHAEVEPLHLLFRLLDRDAYSQSVFTQSGVDPGDALVEAEAVLRRVPQVPNAVAYLSPRMLGLTTRAESEAARDNSPVRTRHLLIALAGEATGLAGAVLRAVDLDEAKLRQAVKSLPDVPAPTVTEVPGESRGGGGGGAAGGAGTEGGDALQKFTRDMVSAAQSAQFDPIVGRDGEIRRVLQVVARRQKNNPVLVGEPGVGKRTIVRAIATRLAAGDVPEPLRKKRLVQLDMGLLVAGAKLRGELEERLRQVLSAARDADGDVILFIEDIHTLFATGTSAGSGPADLLKPALARGEVQVIGTTSTAEYRKNIDKDPALSRLFAPIEVEVPTADEAIGVVRGIVERYEVYHGIRVSDPAVVAAVKFAKRYLGDRALPDPAIDLLDEAAAQTRLALDAGPPELDALTRRQYALEAQHRSLVDEEDAASIDVRNRVEKELSEVRGHLSELKPRWERQRGALAAARVAREKVLALRQERDARIAAGDNARASKLATDEIPRAEQSLTDADKALQAEGALLLKPVVTEENVARVVEQWTGVPVSRMLESETERLMKMEERLKDRVVGQDPAVHVIAKAVRRGRVGLRDPGKPIGSFFFLGPTGVGKTELAKALAEFLFDDEASLIRLDMSEFMEKHMVARLLGSPPGYVDSEEGGMLTETVRRRPYSVVLFDEVEKAHNDVFNILLQVLDDGRLTDSRGRLTDFSNTVVILTSNVGAQRILVASEAGVSEEQLKSEVTVEMRKAFRPEFLNRIDDQVIFDRLKKSDLRGIVDIQLRRLGRLLTESRVKLEVSDAAKDKLTDLGYEPAFGARPLKRVILKQLQDPLAQELLAGTYKAGDTIKVDVTDDKFVFTRLG